MAYSRYSLFITILTALEEGNEFRKYVNIEDCEQLFEQIISKIR